MEPDYSYDEAAKLLSISVASLRRAKRLRQIGFNRHGSRITFSAEHIAAFRAAREVKPLRGAAMRLVGDPA